jgi:tRNA threonylcarbamoyl adenosine modification protein YeaZ
MPGILAVDTSGQSAFVALKCLKTGRVYENRCVEPNSHNEVLAGLVADLLAQAGLSASELTALVVGAGPGSFTGLRIGFSFMQGLSLGRQVALYSISSFRALAFEARNQAALIAVLSDARRDEFFFAIYLSEQGSLRELIRPGIVPRSQVAQEIKQAQLQTGLEDNSILMVSEASPSEIGPMKWGIFKPVQPGVALIDIFDLEQRAGMDDKGIKTLFSTVALSETAPDYIRPVSARTIEERKRAQSGALLPPS